MIKPGELQKIAREAGVRDQQIEKDYILSWILFGIARSDHLSKALVFKGGTVLKKVYFKDYRFSEDLDFTLLNSETSGNQIIDWFKVLANILREEANIPIEIIDYNEHRDSGINFYISYIGPFGGQGSNKKVKVDISRSEQLVFEPLIKTVFTVYSDLTEYQLLSYRLEEILVEKMRSVMQRMQARDLYDIWYLLEIHGMEVEYYINEFNLKCVSKGLQSSDFLTKLYQRLPQYKGRWKNSLKEQIKDLPAFEEVEREVLRHLKKLDL